jgi:methionyl-tRNA formyltransferase
MRVAFLGNDAWSVPPLRALAGAADIEIELVVTNPPRPAGRGSELTATAVEETARELGLPLLEVDGVRGGEGFRALDELEPDGLVVVAYGEILTPEVLDIPRLGSVNVHFSLLPRWRGAAPVQRAILEGDEITGVTVMLMDEGMDTGPILAT